MRKGLALAVGVLATAGAVLAVAQDGERGWRRGGADPVRLEKELGLSAEQAAELRKLRTEGRKQAIRQRADLAIARLELRELVDAAQPDQKAIDAKVKAVADLQAAQLKARTDERLALRRVLSPEQQEKLRQMSRERGERRMRSSERRERRPGRRGAASAPSPGSAEPKP